MAENVRAALTLVARGEAPLGIVYETDAKVEPNVKIVGSFPEDSHPPIIYPVALTVGRASLDRRRKLSSTFLRKSQRSAQDDLRESTASRFLIKPSRRDRSTERLRA